MVVVGVCVFDSVAVFSGLLVSALPELYVLHLCICV